MSNQPQGIPMFNLPTSPDPIQQPQEVIDTYMQPNAIMMHAETTKWLFDPGETIVDLERNLKGLFFNPKTKKWEPMIGAKLINDIGLYKILGLVRSHLYKHVSLSQLTKEEINEITHRVTVILIDTLELEWKKYDINKSNLSTIIAIVEDTIRTNMLRALEGNAARSLRDVTQLREVNTREPAPKRRFGLF